MLSDDKLNIEKAQERCIRVDKINKVNLYKYCILLYTVCDLNYKASAGEFSA
jgi:hypothetical protein